MTRKQVVGVLLDELKAEQKNEPGFSTRGISSIAALVYIVEGTFGEANSQIQHIQQIKENCKLLWRSGGLDIVYDQICRVIESQVPSHLTDDVIEPEISGQLETQLSHLLTVFYLMIETCRQEDYEDAFINDLDNLQPQVLTYLVGVGGRLRWVEGKLPARKLNLVLWKCILCLFGGREKLSQVKEFMRQKYNLPEDYSPDAITASPLDYHAFREDLISRYPSYVPPPSKVPKYLENTQSISHFIQVARPSHTQPSNTALPAPTLHIATPAPSPPLSPSMSPGQKLRKSVFMTNQSFPFLYPTENEVPQSIVEAGELFASRIRTTPAMVQLWDERDRFMQYERGWFSKEDGERSATVETNVRGTSAASGISNSDPCQKILNRIDRFYKDTLLSINSFLNVQLRLMLKSITFPRGEESSTNEEDRDNTRCRDITMKSISAILDLILCWYKVDHILKFEFLSALLFDARYYLFVYKYLYSHNVLEKALWVCDLECTFFNTCRRLSDEWIDNDTTADNNATTVQIDKAIIINDTYNDVSVAVSDGVPNDDNKNNSSDDGSGQSFQEEIDRFSSRYLFTLINLIRVLRRIVKHKTQRVIIVAELPSDTLKKSLTIYQEDLWRIVLDLFKEQVPFNGKKWKYNNMDLISAIYLNCRTKLRDDWLSGVDVNAEIDDAYPQEVALRSLVKFFNDYNSPDGGFRSFKENPDFFSQELEALTISGN